MEPIVMEVFLHNIPHAFDELQLSRSLAAVLHGPDFSHHMGGAPYNFLVRILKGKNQRQKQHSGCGILIVPSASIANLFIQVACLRILSLHGRRLYAAPGKHPARPEDLALLTEPYQDPEILEAQRRRNSEIKGTIRLATLQFGWPCHEGGISIEWESPIDEVWSLEFDPETRRVTITSRSGLYVVVTLKNLQSVELDSHACVLWLERPPMFERQKEQKQNPPGGLAELFGIMMLQPSRLGPTRDRLISLDQGRGNVFAFLRIIRITFDGHHALREFQSKAKKLGLTTYERNYRISKQALFDPLTIGHFHWWLKEVPFDVAFQIDGLVSRCLFNPDELFKARIAIDEAVNKHGESTIRDCVRLLEQRREEDNKGLSASVLFKTILQDLDRDRLRKPPRQSNETGEIFHSHRVTVTPTSLVLTGPLPDETNRVLRKYLDYQSNFIRVEFRDEDRLHLRLDRDVDSSKFMNERIGTILEEGLMIAGRRFEFLAYSPGTQTLYFASSSSALKEHAVWFISPFHGDEGWVDAESIRNGLGDFRRVIMCPARYGARIAQAFSTTEPSITVVPEEMISIPDIISSSGSLFTDGVGTISPEIADEIWESYTETRSKRNRRRLPTPSAFQIRLGGLKGMLCVDENLEGRVVCTRPSMNKFTAPDLEVEIARAFDRPMTMYLNRPLIMLLETLGVPLAPLLELQRDAEKQTVAASKSMESAARLLEQHGLGTAFRLTSILLNLHKLDADFESTRREGDLASFLQSSLKFAVNHVLRDLKYKARIPVSNAWTLVGVADEYNYLREGQIYAYVCSIEGHKEYIQGWVLISRSPTVHPGDARMVWAIGEPPPSAPLGLRELTNCVVFSCQGARSLPSMLAGGDLDGDIYCLVMDQRLHPRKECDPGEYKAQTLVELDRPSTARDVAQFVVNFIQNDLLGVIANQILLTADISPLCMEDEDCKRLAVFHSDAVDFPKTGKSVSFEELPKPRSNRKPDWYANETNERKSEFYPSTRHIGHLFRDVKLPAIPDAQRIAKRQGRTIDENYDIEVPAVKRVYSRNDNLISNLVKRRIDEHVDVDHHANSDLSREIEEMLDIFEGYGSELSYSCHTHSLAKWNALTEEEIVAGTIVAKCSQPRMRNDTISAMRRDSTSLVTAVREQIEGPEGTAREETILRAWTAWKVSIASRDVFGARSFGLIALDVIFTTLSAR